MHRVGDIILSVPCQGQIDSVPDRSSPPCNPHVLSGSFSRLYLLQESSEIGIFAVNHCFWWSL
jgi:hypothetical protein